MRAFIKSLIWYLVSVLGVAALGAGAVFLEYKAYVYIFANVFIQGKYFDQLTADFLTVLLKPLCMVVMIGSGIGAVIGVGYAVLYGFVEIVVKGTIRENRERKLAKEAIDRNPHISRDHLRSAPRDSVHAHTARNDRTAPQHFTHGYRSLDHER